jgi:hypothetical protein
MSLTMRHVLSGGSTLNPGLYSRSTDLACRPVGCKKSHSEDLRMAWYGSALRNTKSLAAAAAAGKTSFSMVDKGGFRRQGPACIYYRSALSRWCAQQESRGESSDNNDTFFPLIRSGPLPLSWNRYLI